jgi:hypothetical protein
MTAYNTRHTTLLLPPLPFYFRDRVGECYILRCRVQLPASTYTSYYSTILLTHYYLSNTASARPSRPYSPLWPRSSTKDRHCARTTRSRTARSPVAPNKPGLAVIPNQPSPILQASVSLSIHHLRCRRPVVSSFCRPLGGACCSVLGVLCQAPLPLATQLSPALLPTSWYLAFAICTAALSPPIVFTLA